MSEERHVYTVIRCKERGKKLARADERGIYLFCRECGVEEFYAWSEILPRQASNEPVTIAFPEPGAASTT